MRRRYRPRILVLALVGAVLVRPDRGRAASAFAGDLEPTQIANFIQLVEHTIHFVQMVQSGKEQVKRWKQTLTSLDGNHFRDMQQLVGLVGGAVGEYQAVSFGAKSLIADFKRAHPGYKSAPSTTAAFQALDQLDQQTMTSVQNSLTDVNTQLDPKSMKAQDDMIGQLAGQIEGSDGMLKALQVADHLLVVLTKQMEKLLVLEGAEASQMSAYLANETQRRSFELKQRDSSLQNNGAPSTSTPIDWREDAFKGM